MPSSDPLAVALQRRSQPSKRAARASKQLAHWLLKRQEASSESEQAASSLAVAETEGASKQVSSLPRTREPSTPQLVQVRISSLPCSSESEQEARASKQLTGCESEQAASSLATEETGSKQREQPIRPAPTGTHGTANGAGCCPHPICSHRQAPCTTAEPPHCGRSWLLSPSHPTRPHPTASGSRFMSSCGPRAARPSSDLASKRAASSLAAAAAALRP